MSVVRKFAPGGSVTTDYSELEKYLHNKINNQLTRKSIGIVEDALSDILDIIKSGKEFTSEGEFKPNVNWAGKISISSPDEAKYQLMMWVKEKKNPAPEIEKAQQGTKIQDWSKLSSEEKAKLIESGVTPDVTKMSSKEASLWSLGINPYKQASTATEESKPAMTKEQVSYAITRAGNSPELQKLLTSVSEKVKDKLNIPKITPESTMAGSTAGKEKPKVVTPAVSTPKVERDESFVTNPEFITKFLEKERNWKDKLFNKSTKFSGEYKFDPLKILIPRYKKEYSPKTSQEIENKVGISENILPEKGKFKMKYEDIAQLVNSGLFLNALSTIGKNYRLTNKALSEQLYAKPTLLTTPNIRVAAPNKIAQEFQASKARTSAERVAENISDLDKSLAYRAQTTKNIEDLGIKGDLADQQQVEQGLARVQEFKQRTDQANTQLLNAYSARVADTLSKMHQNTINANLSKQAELNKLAQVTMQNLKVKEKNKAFNELLEFNKRPDVVSLRTEYNKFLQEASDFNQRKQKDPSLAGSQEEKNLTMKEKLLDTKMQEMVSEQSTLQNKYQYGLFAKGGSLSDKMTLEQVKQSNKIELEELKQYYKKVLKNDELLMKSLIKIFK